MDRAVDRISNLPDDVINKIVSCMPLDDAVRTSTLSSRWRYKWTIIPVLVFPEESWDAKKVEAMFDQTFSLHDGAITKFSLQRCCIKSNSSVSRWLSYLSGHGINSLELSVHCKTQNLVPVSLKGFDHLQHLYLGFACPFKIPHLSKEFNKLVKLELFYSHIKIGELEVLLSKCLMIEYLDLEFKIRGRCEIKELFIKLNHLTFIELRSCNFVDFGNVEVFLSLIKSSPNLQSLKLHGDGAFRDDNSIMEYLKAQHSSNVCLSRLEYVKLRCMMGFPAELEFVKILLRIYRNTNLWKLGMRNPRKVKIEIENIGSVIMEFFFIQQITGASIFKRLQLLRNKNMMRILPTIDL
ncbi:F-box/FBD/LRR-repeat protein At1g13570-like [Andrographis paniculata]|uniref:F-box/FBD/LRR-repeat protein At1g13570-like n=1 Tax=Andrographis paniculata TaxID=175694 RepID=UPI0021E86870|nr:F-box/FBD/LRR-repeat protein At1g13570-like [Andrographis paniculata]